MAKQFFWVLFGKFSFAYPPMPSYFLLFSNLKENAEFELVLRKSFDFSFSEDVILKLVYGHEGFHLSLLHSPLFYQFNLLPTKIVLGHVHPFTLIFPSDGIMQHDIKKPPR